MCINLYSFLALTIMCRYPSNTEHKRCQMPQSVEAKKWGYPRALGAGRRPELNMGIGLYSVPKRGIN
jgi:hypothetical protein